MKNQLTYTRSTTDKVSIKGMLSEDCTTITYNAGDDDLRDIEVTTLLKDFANKNIALTCQVQTSEDLAENLNEDTAEE